MRTFIVSIINYLLDNNYSPRGTAALLYDYYTSPRGIAASLDNNYDRPRGTATLDNG